MKISPFSTFSLNGGLDNTDRYYNYGYQDASGWSTRPTCVNSSYNGAGGGISPFSSEVVVCGHCLVTLSLTINETLKWLSSLPISMQESFWWWQCSDRYIISLFPPPSYPLPCVPNSNTPCGFCGRKALCLLTYLCLILRCLPLIGTHNRFWLHVGSLLVVVRTYGYTLTTSCWYFT